MSDKNLYSLSLDKAKSRVPARLELLIDSALNEHEVYAADELVELAEEF